MRLTRCDQDRTAGATTTGGAAVLFAVVVLGMAIAVFFAGCAVQKAAIAPAGDDGPAAEDTAIVAAELPAEPRELPRDLTLDEALRIALAHNPSLAAYTHNLQAAQARYDEARTMLFPDLDATGSYAQHLDDQRMLPAGYNGEAGVFGDALYAANLSVKMPLFTWGRLRNGVRAADFQQQAAAHSLARMREELIFNVSSLFYRILAQRHVIEAVEFSITALTEHRERVDELVAAAKAAPVDRMRTEVRLASVQQRMTHERNLLSIQRQLLANLMGIAESPAELEPDGALAKEEPEQFHLADCLARAHNQRDDYLAAQADVESLDRQADAIRAKYFPALNLVGLYGMRGAEDPTFQPDGRDAMDDLGQVGVSFDLPIFDGGRIGAQLREQRAKADAARERCRQLDLQIQLEVETALLNYGSSWERVQIAEKAVTLAQEVFRIEQEKYNLGKGAISDVLDAQSELLAAQTDYYSALADYNTAIGQLLLATGESDEE